LKIQKRNCQNKEKRKLYKKWTATVKVKLKFDTTQLIYSKLKFEIKPFVLKERKESSNLGTKGNDPKKEQQQS